MPRLTCATASLNCHYLNIDSEKKVATKIACYLASAALFAAIAGLVHYTQFFNGYHSLFLVRAVSIIASGGFLIAALHTKYCEKFKNATLLTTLVAAGFILAFAAFASALHFNLPPYITAIFAGGSALCFGSFAWLLNSHVKSEKQLNQVEMSTEELSQSLDKELKINSKSSLSKKLFAQMWLKGALTTEHHRQMGGDYSKYFKIVSKDLISAEDRIEMSQTKVAHELIKLFADEGAHQFFVRISTKFDDLTTQASDYLLSIACQTDDLERAKIYLAKGAYSIELLEKAEKDPRWMAVLAKCKKTEARTAAIARTDLPNVRAHFGIK